MWWQASCQLAAGIEADCLKSAVALGRDDWFLAKISPKVEAAADVLLDGGAQLASRLLQTPALHALSLTAYSGFSSVIVRSSVKP